MKGLGLHQLDAEWKEKVVGPLNPGYSWNIGAKLRSLSLEGKMEWPHNKKQRLQAGGSSYHEDK